MTDPWLMADYLPKSDSCCICGKPSSKKERLWGRRYCASCYDKFYAEGDE